MITVAIIIVRPVDRRSQSSRERAHSFSSSCPSREGYQNHSKSLFNNVRLLLICYALLLEWQHSMLYREYIIRGGALKASRLREIVTYQRNGERSVTSCLSPPSPSPSPGLGASSSSHRIAMADFLLLNRIQTFQNRFLCPSLIPRARAS